MSMICVYCASSENIEPRYVELAAAVGHELASRGHSLVSGGGCVSCMGAVARAARAGGARTIGVIPEGLVNREVADADADELVVTTDMRQRKAEMDRRSDAFLALPGGIGTIEEIFDIWVSRTLGMHSKPLVILDPEGIYSLLREQIDALTDRGFVRAAARDSLLWMTSVDAAFDALESAMPTPPLSINEALEAQP